MIEGTGGLVRATDRRGHADSPTQGSSGAGNAGDHDDADLRDGTDADDGEYADDKSAPKEGTRCGQTDRRSIPGSCAAFRSKVTSDVAPARRAAAAIIRSANPNPSSR